MMEKHTDLISPDEYSTFLTEEISNKLSTKERIEVIAAVRKENNRLQAENHVLRKQLYLLKQNSGFKVASLVSKILAWIEEHKDEPIEANEVFNDIVLQNLDSIRASPEMSTDNLDDTIALVLKPLKEKLSNANKHTIHVNDSHRSDAGATKVKFNAARTKEENFDINHETKPVRRRLSVNPPPVLNQSHGYVLERQGYQFKKSNETSGSQSQSDNNKQAKQSQKAPTVLTKKAQGETIQHGHTWQKLPSAEGIGIPVAASTFNHSNLEQHYSSSSTDESSMESSKSDKHSLEIDDHNNAFSQSPGTDYWGKFIANSKGAKRLIGEVAFQLDRRILTHIFGGVDAKNRKKRFYGYIIKNIPEMIHRESVDPVTGILDEKRKSVLEYRRRYVLHSLGPLGYRVDRHADVASYLVNTYGLLPVSQENTRMLQHVSSRQQIEEVIKKIATPQEIPDITILLDCLALLAGDDGKPLFIW